MIGVRQAGMARRTMVKVAQRTVVWMVRVSREFRWPWVSLRDDYGEES